MRYLILFLLPLLCIAQIPNYFELDLRDLEATQETYPIWLEEVTEEGGKLTPEGGWQIKANKPFGIGRLYLTLDSEHVSHDLALSFFSETPANIAVQLYDDQDRALAIDLLAQVSTAENATLVSLVIPLSQYTTAKHIVLRRLDGPLSISALSLIELTESTPQSEARLSDLAKLFGDPLAPENPLVLSLRQQANAKTTQSLLTSSTTQSQPLIQLSQLGGDAALTEHELVGILMVLGLQGYDFNALDFVRAAGEGREEVVKLYLRAGMPINVQGDNKYTAIAEAANSGELRVLQLLCDNDADPEIRTAGGNTALWMAAYTSNFEAIRLLVQSGADVNAICVRGETAANILLQNRQRNTEKTLAAFKYLLEKGTNPNIQDKRQRNLLHSTIEDGWTREVTEILKYSPDLTAIDSRGFTPMMAVKYRKNATMERALLDAGAEDWEPAFNTIDERLVYHIHRREFDIALKLITKEGANPNINDKDGNPIAFRIVRSEQIGTLKSMMAAGLDIFVHGHGNKTLLTAPNSRPDSGKDAIVQYLLDQGLDPNYATPEGLKKKRPYWTPLMAAANSGNVNRCRILLKAGADPRVKNLPRRTAAMIAERAGYFQLAQELKAAEVTYVETN